MMTTASPSARMSAPRRARRVGTTPRLGLLMITLATVVGRLPFAARPLSPDEGGFLLVASQWSQGPGLYGDYWVDRPPLLIAFFEVADHLGGTLPLRVLGITLAVVSVLLAARLGRLVATVAGVEHAARTRASLAAAAATGIFLVTPLFGSYQVDGELIAVPLVLLGITLALEWASRPAPRRTWLVAAGAVGAAAVLVKQSEIDVFVALVLTIAALAPGRSPVTAVRDLAMAAAGALALTGVVLVWAASRGTDPAGLWEAMVTFRLDASAVIHASAGPRTAARFWHVMLTLLVSGGLLLPLQVLISSRRTDRSPLARLRWLVLAVTAWESVTVLGGGSYWLHYLVGLVPGLALCAALGGSLPGRSVAWLRISLAYPAVVAVAATVLVAIGTADRPSEQPVSTWLTDHARPGDTAVVAYGHPNILRTTGMSSPYAQLWSLPVKVRDPELAGLDRVLGGTDRPTWVIATNGSTTHALAAWGIEATDAEATLEEHYRVVAHVDDHVIYLERSRSLG